MDVGPCLYCKQLVCMLCISCWKFGFHIAVQVSIERSAYELDFQNANNICMHIFIYKKVSLNTVFTDSPLHKAGVI